MSRNSAREKRRGAWLTLVRRQRRRMRPTVFELEHRALLSTLVVNSATGPYYTIQSAITAAGSTPSTILVYNGNGYNESDSIAGNQTLNIESPALQAPVLNGSSPVVQTSPGFTIAAGASVSISGLTIEDFYIVGNGAAINTAATHLTLTNDTITSNAATCIYLTGMNSYGGGIANFGGDVTLKGVTLDDNYAVGGLGASGNAGHPAGGAGGAGLGGGLYTFGGQILITGSTVGTSASPNVAFGGDGGHGRTATGTLAFGGAGGAGGNGGNGQGGGIYAAGGASLVILNTTFDNVAVGGFGGNGGNGFGLQTPTPPPDASNTPDYGGAGGAGGNGGNGQGGAIFSANGTVETSSVGIVHNYADGGPGGNGGQGGNAILVGAAGGAGGNGGNGQGGGVYNGTGGVIVAGGYIDSNYAYGGIGGNGGKGGGSPYRGYYAPITAGAGGNGGNGGNAQGAGLYSGAGAIAINSADVAANYAGGGGGGAGGTGGTASTHAYGRAEGGAGGNGGNGGNAQGGGVYIGTGDLALNYDAIFFNQAEGGAGGAGGKGGLGGYPATPTHGPSGVGGTAGYGQGGGLYIGVPAAYVIIDTFIGDNSVSGGPGTGYTNVCIFC